MAKLAILFLVAVAFQATSAGVPRFMDKETITTHWDFKNTNSMEMMMHMDMFFKSFYQQMEYEVMDKEMMLCCIQKFIKCMDMLCEKLECATCTDKVFMECIMMCKSMKMECEKMLMCTEVQEMKMMFMNCCRMFYMEMKKCCMHEEFCARLMQTNFMMHFRMMFDECCKKDFMGMISGHYKVDHTNFAVGGYTYHKDLTMEMKMWFKKFMTFCENTDMSHDMMMTCIRKFMTVIDFCMEKMCVGGKCHGMMMSEICSELKTIKMGLERCLTFDMYQMKMECMECCQMFFKCMEKMMMCDDCCVGFDMMYKEICMCCIDFCKMMCSGMDFSMISHHDLPMKMHMLVKKVIEYCETGKMSKDMMMMYMRKFMMIIDYTMEKLCFGGKCKDSMMSEICMELKTCKMMLERCLSYEMFTDFYKMKMECCECIKMFASCMEKWMMCDNCCVGGEMMWKDICMRFMNFCEMMCEKTYMTKNFFIGDYTYHKDLTMDMKMWFKKFMTFCENTDMSHDMMMMCIRKFITVIDFCMEKMCVGGKCHGMMMSEICSELKSIKMGLERCLTFNMYQMKMECMECCKMFFKCMEKMMMCDDCCIGFDMMYKEICMCCIDFCKMMCSGMNFSMMNHHDFPMNMNMLMKKLIQSCESGKMSKDMMMICMRKFMMIIDYTMEKLCFGGKCKDSMMSEICMELKNCKMMLERCLSYGMFTDFYKMKMECCECIKMFFKCMEKWMMCDNCCVGGEMMWKDIFMRCENFCTFVFKYMNTYSMDYSPITKDFTPMYSMPYVFHRYIKY